jgi:hypothetical protein
MFKAKSRFTRIPNSPYLHGRFEKIVRIDASIRLHPRCYVCGEPFRINQTRVPLIQVLKKQTHSASASAYVHDNCLAEWAREEFYGE